MKMMEVNDRIVFFGETILLLSSSWDSSAPVWCINKASLSKIRVSFDYLFASSNYLLLYSSEIQVWNDLSLSTWQNFYFWVSYTFKEPCRACLTQGGNLFMVARLWRFTENSDVGSYLYLRWLLLFLIVSCLWFQPCLSGNESSVYGHFLLKTSKSGARAAVRSSEYQVTLT